MRLGAILGALLLSGCASSETVSMRNASGQTVTCGPYTSYGNIPAANRSTFEQLRACMDDFERQGYKRIPR